MEHLDTRMATEGCLRSVAGFLLPTYASNPHFPLLVCLRFCVTPFRRTNAQKSASSVGGGAGRFLS